MTNDELIKQFAQIEYDCWKKNLAPVLNISDYLYYKTPLSIAEEIKDLLRGGKAKVIRYEDHDNKDFVIGFAIITYDSNHKKYIIEKLFITPQYQNKHLGQNMIKAIIDNFGEYPIGIKVFENYRPIHNVLLKQGFKGSQKKTFNLEYGKNSIPVEMKYYLYKGEQK